MFRKGDLVRRRYNREVIGIIHEAKKCLFESGTKELWSYKVQWYDPEGRKHFRVYWYEEELTLVCRTED